MSERGVSVHPAALRETEAALEWYGERSYHAELRFLDELYQLISRIATQPSQFPQYEFGTWRAVLHRFPYFVVFRESDSGCEIVAVAHGRRRPGYWKDRVQ